MAGGAEVVVFASVEVSHQRLEYWVLVADERGEGRDSTIERLVNLCVRIWDRGLCRLGPVNYSPVEDTTGVLG